MFYLFLDENTAFFPLSIYYFIVVNNFIQILIFFFTVAQYFVFCWSFSFGSFGFLCVLLYTDAFYGAGDGHTFLRKRAFIFSHFFVRYASCPLRRNNLRVSRFSGRANMLLLACAITCRKNIIRTSNIVCVCHVWAKMQRCRLVFLFAVSVYFIFFI